MGLNGLSSHRVVSDSVHPCFNAGLRRTGGLSIVIADSGSVRDGPRTPTREYFVALVYSGCWQLSVLWPVSGLGGYTPKETPP